MVRLKLSYCYNYIKLVNGKAKIKLLLQLHSNIELMIEHDEARRVLPLYAPARLGFHRQDQSCNVAIPCAVLTMALLTDQLFGLKYAHV